VVDADGRLRFEPLRQLQATMALGLWPALQGSPRAVRGFPRSEAATPDELLIQLNLLHGDRPSHAAVLLFGLQP
jgi:hypothetical protein